MVGISDQGALSQLISIITNNRSGLGDAISRIASGSRLINASADPAGLALAAKLKSEIAALAQTVDNAETGVNFINAAEGGLSAVNDLVTRGRELALQAANGTQSDSARQILNVEFQQILSGIDQLSQSQEFNGQQILNGDLSPTAPTQVNIQVGAGTGPANQISLNVIEAVDTATLGLAGLDISTSAGAQAALAPLETAQQTVLRTRTEVGTVANRLSTAADNTRTTIENLTGALDQIAATDIAGEISELKGALARLEASIQALNIQNRQNESTVGRLLDIRT
ncbi:MAG: hypothetical protein E2O44_03475 [Nitrospina sp.]|nr:MAG: hypothetical protein E2O44_03475 [Nitrospina sp.]